jgi:hypothetical protein
MPVDDLRDLVPGDLPAVRACRRWLTELDQHVRALARALRAVLHADASAPAARDSIYGRARQCALHLAECVSAHPYLDVVADPVLSWVVPVLADVATACRDLVAALERPPLAPGELTACLARIQAAKPELWHLAELLAVAQVIREDPAPDPSVPATKTNCGRAKAGRGTVNQRMLDLLQGDPDSCTWTQRQWSERLRCAPSAVAKAPAWRTIRNARALYAADRIERDRRRR